MSVHIPVEIGGPDESVFGYLTTDHPACSYGQPVLVIGGRVYGRGDKLVLRRRTLTTFEGAMRRVAPQPAMCRTPVVEVFGVRVGGDEVETSESIAERTRLHAEFVRAEDAFLGRMPADDSNLA